MNEHTILADVPADVGDLDCAALRVQAALLGATRIKLHFEHPARKGYYNWSIPVRNFTAAKLADLAPRAQGYTFLKVSVGDDSL